MSKNKAVLRTEIAAEMIIVDKSHFLTDFCNLIVAEHSEGVYLMYV